MFTVSREIWSAFRMDRPLVYSDASVRESLPYRRCAPGFRFFGRCTTIRSMAEPCCRRPHEEDKQRHQRTHHAHGNIPVMGEEIAYAHQNPCHKRSSMSVNISPNIGRINVNITIMTSTSRIISTMGYARAPLT